MYAWEAAEAISIFGASNWLARVWIHEGTRLPDWLDDIGRWLKRIPARPANAHNAITLGWHIYFPLFLRNQPALDDAARAENAWQMAWLMHELTHCWQFRQVGWNYLWQALKAQFREGQAVYHYGGEPHLRESWARGGNFFEYHVEKQAALVQQYCERRLCGKDTSAWEPFIAQMREQTRPPLG